MLATTDLLVLGEQLSPPPGYEADAIVAATYSLELPMALALPLAVVRQGRFAGETAESAGALATLDAIRRFSKRCRVFHDSTALLPVVNHRLLCVLHRVCIPVRVPPRRNLITSFHPKFVLVLFKRPGAPTRLRLVCMSRNLTGSAALDISAVLDGEVVDPARGDASSTRLAAALRRLPEWSRHPEDDGTTAMLAQEMAGMVERAAWRVPPGFNAVGIWPLGFSDDGSDPVLPREAETRSLVMSPFLNRTRLKALSRDGADHVLISEQREIDAMDEPTLRPFTKRLVLTARAPGDGLHAKLYVHEAGRSARWLIGSANATEAAATRNAELVIELEGPRRGNSIDTLLDDENGMGTLLRRADETGGAEPVNRSSPSETAFRAFSASELEATVAPDVGAGHTVTVRANPPLPADGVTVRVAFPRHPISAAMAPDGVLSRVAREYLSRWLVVEVTAPGDVPHRRLLAVKLIGADLVQLAEDAVTDLVQETGDPFEFLRGALSGATPETVGLRFDDDEDPPPEREPSPHEPPPSASTTAPLLEQLLARLEGHRDAVGDDVIDGDVELVVENMRERLPKDFLDLWEILREVRRLGALR